MGAEASTGTVTSCVRRSSAGRPLCARSARRRRWPSSTRGRPRSLKSERPAAHPPQRRSPSASVGFRRPQSADKDPLDGSLQLQAGAAHKRRARGLRDRPPRPAAHSRGEAGPGIPGPVLPAATPQRTAEPPQVPLIFLVPSG